MEASRTLSATDYSLAPLDERSKALRRQIVKTMAAGNRGHLGSALSLVEILRVLYDDILKFDPKNPFWKDRDRCVLSKGHGCLALYVLLAEKGFFPEEELWKFCKPDGMLGGHPERGKVPGVEASTGSLGHGVSIAVGMALAARIDKKNHRVFAISSDGESNEGSIWEAALAAGKHRLENFTVLVDYNKQQSYSSTYEVLNLEPLADKWRAFGFGVREIDGHDVNALRGVLTNLPIESGRPTTIICHTVKGRGVPHAESNPAWHHKNKITPEELNALMEALK